MNPEVSVRAFPVLTSDHVAVAAIGGMPTNICSSGSGRDAVTPMPPLVDLRDGR